MKDFKNIGSALSRAEMKKVVAGDSKETDIGLGCISADSCTEGCMEIDRKTSQPKCSGCCIV